MTKRHLWELLRPIVWSNCGPTTIGIAAQMDIEMDTKIGSPWEKNGIATKWLREAKKPKREYRASRNHWIEPQDHLTRQLLNLLRLRYEFAINHVHGVVFEAGCGHGYGTHLLRQSHNITKIHAWDIDPVAIEIAEENIPIANALSVPATFLEVCDIENEELPEFDWMVCTEVMEHLNKPNEFLEKAKTRARHGIVLSWPLNVEPGKKGHPDHKTMFKPGDMKRMMSGWKGKIEQIEEFRENGDVAVVYDLGAFKRA